MAGSVGMNVSELTEIASDFLREAYGLPLEIPIKRNNRLRIALGRYVASYENVPLRIEVAGFLLNYGADSEVVSTLKHECIHYALDVLGKPNDDGHPIFEAELIKHGVASTESSYVGKVYVFTCDGCASEYETTKSRVFRTPQIFTSVCCKSRISIVGERIYNGTEVNANANNR